VAGGTERCVTERCLGTSPCGLWRRGECRYEL